MQLALKAGKPLGTNFSSYTLSSHFLHNNLQRCSTQLTLQDPVTIHSNITHFQGYLMPSAHY